MVPFTKSIFQLTHANLQSDYINALKTAEFKTPFSRMCLNHEWIDESIFVYREKGNAESFSCILHLGLESDKQRIAILESFVFGGHLLHIIKKEFEDLLTDDPMESFQLLDSTFSLETWISTVKSHCLYPDLLKQETFALDLHKDLVKLSLNVWDPSLMDLLNTDKETFNVFLDLDKMQTEETIDTNETQETLSPTFNSVNEALEFLRSTYYELIYIRNV